MMKQHHMMILRIEVNLYIYVFFLIDFKILDRFVFLERKIRYCVTIYPSHEKEGNFNPNESSQIYLFLNNHTKQTYLLNQSDKSCPKFEAGVEKEFNIDLVQHINEKPKTLKIGYINSNPEAEKWKLKKVNFSFKFYT